MPTNQPSLVVSLVFAAVLLFGIYVASAAPVTAALGESPNAYRPVYWMVVETPLRDPLLRWADVWGVRREFQWSSPKAQEIYRHLGR